MILSPIEKWIKQRISRKVEFTHEGSTTKINIISLGSIVDSAQVADGGDTIDRDDVGSLIATIKYLAKRNKELSSELFLYRKGLKKND